MLVEFKNTEKIIDNIKSLKGLEVRHSKFGDGIIKDYRCVDGHSHILVVFCRHNPELCELGWRLPFDYQRWCFSDSLYEIKKEDRNRLSLI